MEPRLSFVTLGVTDMARSIAFYEDLLRLPRIPLPPEADIAFFGLGVTWFALYPRELLAKDACVDVAAPGFGNFTLAHNVKTPDAVDALMAEVAAGGGRIVKPAARADWGGYGGYFADPDGFLWEVAFNPYFPHA